MFKLSNILLNPHKAERHPFEIIFVAFFYVSLSLALGLWMFPEYSSLFTIFLSVISCLYIIQGVLIVEEKKEEDNYSEKLMLKEHSKTIWFLLLLFIGFLLAFTFWVIVLPNSYSESVFKIQKEAFTEISSITGKIVSSDNFTIILSNNLRVLLLSIVLALFYGAGSIFILVWNASIMGFVIGSLTKNIFGFISLPHIFLKYFLHGIPEMVAYFIGSLAGGIMFISLVRGNFKNRAKKTFLDVFLLVLISVLILIIAALIEVYISPLV